MAEYKDNPDWRVLRALRDLDGRRKLRREKPAALSRNVSSQIKAPKDARGKRMGTDEN